LVSVEVCSLPGTGVACVGVAVSDLFMGEPFGEESISSITEGPCLVVPLLLEKPKQPTDTICRLVGLVVWIGERVGEMRERKIVGLAICEPKADLCAQQGS